MNSNRHKKGPTLTMHEPQHQEHNRKQRSRHHHHGQRSHHSQQQHSRTQYDSTYHSFEQSKAPFLPESQGIPNYNPNIPQHPDSEYQYVNPPTRPQASPKGPMTFSAKAQRSPAGPVPSHHQSHNHPGNHHRQQQQAHHNQQQHRQRHPSPNAPLRFEDLLKKWDELQKNYLEGRRRYFETFYKLTPQQKMRSENEISDIVKQIRKLEATMQQQFKSAYQKRFAEYDLEHGYISPSDLPEIDTNNAHEEVIEEVITVVDAESLQSPQEHLQQQLPNEEQTQQEMIIIDPHLTTEQINRPQYKNDREMSTGNMEDYYEIKAGKSSPN